MEEGTLAKWLVKEGDKVAAGDVIAEIETDKAVMEVEAVDEGTLARILVEEGAEGVAVNKAIAVLLEEGEDAAALAGFDAEGAGVVSAVGVGEADGSRPASGANGGATDHAVAGGEVAEPAAASPPRGSANGPEGRVFASPLARRIAGQAGLDLALVAGSGPNGRIVRRDIEKALSDGVGRTAAAEAAASAPAQPLGSGLAVVQPTAMADDKVLALYEPGSYDIVPHDNMRKTIARRLVEAKTTIPHFYLTIDCQLDELLRARKRMNEAARGRYRLSVNDFIIKAMALALQQAPDANATWTSEGMLKHQRSDVGVAVAVEGGLFTPIIRHADLKTLSEISNDMKDLAERARKRRLAPHEYQGGTTAISNLGMFAIKRFDAVINPPHATILAVGAGEQRPIVVDGAVQVATVMSCTLSCDHRVVDGALGAELLAAFKSFIEDPVRMLV